ncbi:MAG: TolC family protein, partial [Cycloclasticus sp.]
DKRLAAQQYDYQALKWQRVDILRDMRQKLRAEYGNWQRLQQRSTRYQQQLLSQAAAHASAALSAYQSGVVNFSTLMYARISELDIRLRASRVEIDLLKAQAELLFYRVTVLPPQQGDKHAL